jgi:hypothetical protein
MEPRLQDRMAFLLPWRRAIKPFSVLPQSLSPRILFRSILAVTDLQSFTMAVVDMRYVQFWEPPSAIPSHKQRQAIPPQWKSNSSLATSVRSQPTPPHTKADQILQNIEQPRSATTAITPQQQDFKDQHGDEAEGGQGMVKEPPKISTCLTCCRHRRL